MPKKSLLLSAGFFACKIIKKADVLNDELHPICPTVFGLTNGVLLYVGKTKDVQRRMRPIS